MVIKKYKNEWNKRKKETNIFLYLRYRHDYFDTLKKDVPLLTVILAVVRSLDIPLLTKVIYFVVPLSWAAFWILRTLSKLGSTATTCKRRTVSLLVWKPEVNNEDDRRLIAFYPSLYLLTFLPIFAMVRVCIPMLAPISKNPASGSLFSNSTTCFTK